MEDYETLKRGWEDELGVYEVKILDRYAPMFGEFKEKEVEWKGEFIITTTAFEGFVDERKAAELFGCHKVISTSSSVMGYLGAGGWLQRFLVVR